MKLLKYIFKNPLEFSLCIILVSLVIISFAQVISRYVLHVSLSWSEESCRFLLMWLGMLSAAYGFKVKSHFSLSFIKNKFSIRFQRLVTLVTTGLMSVFLVIFIFFAIEITITGVGRLGPGTQLSYAVPYSSTIVGGILMLYYLLLSFYKDYFLEKNKNKTI